ncbi:phage tail tape measure protein [Streptomyces sp. NPDC102279]|uniref:phage tail tape measure protein n=1 Tax=Streptomyces sp. NPDC102279 TaxID=3366153 RepID=UPI0038064735
MALTVGELNAVLSVDDRAVDPALRRAEDAIRTAGQTMGDDAERAGQRAGEDLGEGVVRGADGRLRTLNGRFVRAGQQAGEGLGDGVRRGSGEVDDAAGDAGESGGQSFMQRMRERGSAGVSDLAGSIREGLASKLGLAAVGAAAGAALMAAIGTAMEQGQITGRLGAQLGKTPEEARRYGKMAGQLYASAVTEDFQGAADAISVTMRAGIAPPGATNAQIQSIATNVADLANTFELDLGQTANAVGQMIKTGLAKNGGEAVDALTVGLQKMGPRADDIADTFNEYSTIFRQMGLNATTATGLLSQGMKAGARDTDVVADALKEFTLITQGGGDKVDAAFKKIGLSGKDMQAAFIKGGPEAAAALDKTFDGLRKMKPGVDRNNVAMALFATKSEDTQKALMALDPSTATDALGKVGGAADKMGNTLRDNAGTKLEAFKRGMQQRVVDFLGGQVLPALTGLRSMVGKAFGSAWDDAGKGGEKGIDRVVKTAELIGQRLVDKLKEMGPKVIEGLIGMGQKIADYVTANPEAVFKMAAIAGALAVVIANLPTIMAGLLLTAAYLIIGGFVDHLIKATDEKLTGWWNTFTTWVSTKSATAGTVMSVLGVVIGHWFSGLWSNYVAGPVSGAWNSFIGTVRGLPGRASGALSGLATAIVARALTAWISFRNASAKKAVEFVAWMHGLPARIASSMGSLSGLLTQKGRNVVQGLWVGIQGMGGWIRSKLMSWAKSAIPGPIAKALGINSPSKVTTAQGRWIARGLIEGLTGSTKQVKAASMKLSDIIADALKPGKRRSAALSKLGAGTKQLLRLAKQEESLAAKSKTATKKLDDLRKARKALAADVAKGVLDSANITKQETGGWGQTAETILAGLRQDTAAAQVFAKNLATLRKKGVRADLVAQIAQAGVEQGSSAAAALANANATQVKQINSQQKALVTAANKAGTTAGDAMYASGIHAAQGLVKGLASQQKAIESQMLKIAKGMSSAIRKALGIKSPSRVMALVGQYTAQGLIKGVEGQRGAVNSTMQSLVDTPAPGSWDSASARARAGVSERAVLELRSSGRPEDDYLMGRLQRGIRKTAGKDVSLALTGRRSG